MPADLGSQRERWGLGPQILMGVAPKFWTKFLKLHSCRTFSVIKVANRSSDLKDSAAKEKKKETSVEKIEYLRSH